MYMTNQAFPETINTAKVIPTFKTGHKKHPENFRPISHLKPMTKMYYYHDDVVTKQQNSELYSFTYRKKIQLHKCYQ